jgi:ornithine cyclodeaminase/alanine dehydrogenase-like protein (mu-crystallin family)
VAELGRILVSEEEGRTEPDDVTVFDSTGLAVQDLAVALAVYERWRANRGAEAFVEVVEIDVV